MISGDVRAVQFLREHLPVRVGEVVTEVQGDHGSPDEALRRARPLVAAAVAADTAALLAEHDRASGEGRAVGGADDALAALRAGQVHTLLLDPARAAGCNAWFGPDGSQVGPTFTELRATGALDPEPAPLVDVLVRAAMSTAAAVRIVPEGTPATARQGVAALLRYR